VSRDFEVSADVNCEESTVSLRTGLILLNCVACSGLADVILVMDASDSIRIERFPRVIELLTAVVEQMDVDSGRVRVGAVKFAKNSTIEFHLNRFTSRQDVMDAVQRVTFVGGRTNISGALWTLVLVHVVSYTVTPRGGQCFI